MSQQTVNTTFPSITSGISYSPADLWHPLAAPGATTGSSYFDYGDRDTVGYGDASLTWTFPEAATGIEYWAWQRSDGGLFSICFDCTSTSTMGTQIDAVNTSTNGSEAPRLLYAKYDLPFGVHNVTLVNLFDLRATTNNATNGGYGQMSLDRFILIAPSQASTSSSSSSITSLASSTTTTPTTRSGSATSLFPTTPVFPPSRLASSPAEHPSTQSSSTATSASLSVEPVSSSPSPTTDPETAPVSASKSDLGPILGGAIGGGLLLFLMLAGVGFFLFRRITRPRRQRCSLVSHKPESPSQENLRPFAYVLGPPEGLASRPLDITDSVAIHPLAISRSLEPSVKSGRTLTAFPTVGPVSTRGSSVNPLPFASPQRERDAGPFGGDPLATLPPDYHEATASATNSSSATP